MGNLMNARGIKDCELYLNDLELSLVAGKVKPVKSAYEPSGSSGRSLSRFQRHEATRSISAPTALNSPVLIYTPGWREALRE